MLADDLDRKARIRRFVRNLRAECVRLGVPRDRVERMSTVELLATHDRALRNLMMERPRAR